MKRVWPSYNDNDFRTLVLLWKSHRQRRQRVQNLSPTSSASASPRLVFGAVRQLSRKDSLLERRRGPRGSRTVSAARLRDSLPSPRADHGLHPHIPSTSPAPGTSALKTHGFEVNSTVARDSLRAAFPFKAGRVGHPEADSCPHVSFCYPDHSGLAIQHPCRSWFQSTV